MVHEHTETVLRKTLLFASLTDEEMQALCSRVSNRDCEWLEQGQHEER